MKPHFYCEDAKCGGPAKLERTIPPGSDDPQALPGGVHRRWKCTKCGRVFYSSDFRDSTLRRIEFARDQRGAERLLARMQAVVAAADSTPRNKNLAVEGAPLFSRRAPKTRKESELA